MEEADDVLIALAMDERRAIEYLEPVCVEPDQHVAIVRFVAIELQQLDVREADRREGRARGC